MARIALDIDIPVDDSPVALERAREEGILVATLLHPSNRELKGEDGFIAAQDWGEPRERLEPRLDGLRESTR